MIIMKFIVSVLFVILTSAQFVTLFLTLYQIITGIGMFGRNEKSILVRGSQLHNFSLLVCAHNEEKVVGQIVDNLLSLDYPKDKYDVYVICDNCTDQTADIVRAHGGKAMERNETEKKGKGYGLEWMFKKLWAMEDDGQIYDAVVVFDADNLVNTNFLTEMNQKLNEGYEVAQGYLDSKNPGDTWVSKSYAIAYWATNRLYQFSREKLRLSAQLGGTGFMVTVPTLKELGWGATSLTEDLEFTVRYILQTNKRVAWVHQAVIYDEKPLKMKASFVQRIRWMKGHFSCSLQYSFPLIKRFLRKPSLVAFDMLIYLNQPYRVIFSLNVLVLLMISYLYPLPAFVSHWVLNFWAWKLIILISFIQFITALLLERKTAKIAWFFWVFVFSISWIPVIIIAFFKRHDKTWSHTQHERAISSTELQMEN